MRRGLFTLLEELWKEHIVPGVCGLESHNVPVRVISPYSS